VNKALITGGAGFIGYHLSSRLLAGGFEVHAYDNCLRGSIDASIEVLRAHRRYRLILGDLMDDSCFCKLGNDYTHIFHMAAIVGVRHVVEKPYHVLRDNVSSLMNALEMGRRQKNLRRFVFPSTSEVYAGTLQYFGLKIPTPEATPLTVTNLGEPRTSYMLSKIYGEALCRHAGLPFTIFRPHNVYGPRMGMAHVVPELLTRAYRSPVGGKLLVFSANHKRTFCYVDDAVELIVRIADSALGMNEVFNIGSTGEETSIAALAELVAATVGKPLTIETGPETKGSPNRRRPDVSSAISVASYTPSVSLPEGIRRTYEWYRAHMLDAAIPIYEPGLDQIVESNTRAGRLRAKR
jgi:UDP-glucose 4-epimerase